jgi:hypothetical protein
MSNEGTNTDMDLAVSVVIGGLEVCISSVMYAMGSMTIAKLK